MTMDEIRAVIKQAKPVETADAAAYHIVWAKWYDSEQPHSEWEWSDDVEQREAMEIDTVGYMVYATETTIGLSMSKSQSARRVMLNGMFRIPLTAIHYIEIINARPPA